MINSFIAPDTTNASQYPEPSSGVNGRQQIANALSSITNQLNAEITNKMGSTINGGGAAQIACTNLAVNSGTNVWSNLLYTYNALVNSVLGAIPDGSLTLAKLSTEAYSAVSTFTDSATNTRYELGSTNGVVFIRAVV